MQHLGPSALGQQHWPKPWPEWGRKRDLPRVHGAQAYSGTGTRTPNSTSRVSRVTDYTIPDRASKHSRWSAWNLDARPAHPRPSSRQREQSPGAMRRGARRCPASATTTRLHTALSLRSRRGCAGARARAAIARHIRRLGSPPGSGRRQARRTARRSAAPTAACAGVAHRPTAECRSRRLQGLPHRSGQATRSSRRARPGSLCVRTDRHFGPLSRVGLCQGCRKVSRQIQHTSSLRILTSALATVPHMRIERRKRAKCSRSERIHSASLVIDADHRGPL